MFPTFQLKSVLMFMFNVSNKITDDFFIASKKINPGSRVKLGLHSSVSDVV